MTTDPTPGPGPGPGDLAAPVDPAAPTDTAARAPAPADPAAPAPADPAAPVPGRDHYVVSRLLDAEASAVFALLTDPARHHETEPTDWVRGPLEADPPPLTEVGQIFGIEMFHENAGGRYDMHNRVIALEPEHAIAWQPGQYEPDGSWGSGGWTWRYDLAPAHDGTRVTITYDWSRVPEPLRAEFGLPPFPPSYLEESLAALERAAGRTG